MNFIDVGVPFVLALLVATAVLSEVREFRRLSFASFVALFVIVASFTLSACVRRDADARIRVRYAAALKRELWTRSHPFKSYPVERLSYDTGVRFPVGPLWVFFVVVLIAANWVRFSQLKKVPRSALLLGMFALISVSFLYFVYNTM